MAKRISRAPAQRTRRKNSKNVSRNQKARRRGRAFSKEQTGCLKQVMAMLGELSPDLRRWLVLNLAIMTVAMLQLWRGARSGNGWLTLCALSRAMPLDETEKARSKRLYRLLANKHLDGTEMTPLLVRLALGDHPPPWVPIVVDQTTIRGVETIMAGIRLAGRVLPVAFTCFLKSEIRKSQNITESSLLKLVAACLPAGCKPLFVMDRGYARAALLQQLRLLRIPFLIRGRRKTTVYVEGKGKSLGQLSHRRGKPRRYADARYQGTLKEPVDLVVFHDPNFKEPWYLIVPANSEDLLSTQQVVDLYRERMWVELTFRDWKTHLGVRGLRLEEDTAARMGRLLLALSVAYIVAVLLGACSAATRVREDCEVLRRTPRHGTRKRLGALNIGILLLSLGRFAKLAERALKGILNALTRGRGALNITPVPAWLPGSI